MTWRIGNVLLAGAEIFPFAIAFTLVLRPAQLPLQCVQVALYSRVMLPEDDVYCSVGFSAGG